VDASTQQEIWNIQHELQSIIDELHSISYGLRHEFAGIGSDRCARTVENVAEQYRYVRNRVYNIDESALTEEFIAATGGDASGGGGGHAF